MMDDVLYCTDNSGIARRWRFDDEVTSYVLLIYKLRKLESEVWMERFVW
jgi:hypothetical protein